MVLGKTWTDPARVLSSLCAELISLSLWPIGKLFSLPSFTLKLVCDFIHLCFCNHWPLLHFLPFFFLCFPSLSLFLSNSYLFSNLPQEISTLIGSQQNKKERKTQYLKDEYLGESISLLMSWFQSGLFAIYMSIITIHLRTAVLLLKQRFLTAWQTLCLSFTCREEGNDGIPSTQRGTLAQSNSHIQGSRAA